MKITTEEAFQKIKIAYQETLKRSQTGWQPIISTKKQLEYCIEALMHKNDRSRLKDIMFYQYTIHEFEQDDPEFAHLLHEAYSVVDLMLQHEL